MWTSKGECDVLALECPQFDRVFPQRFHDANPVFLFVSHKIHCTVSLQRVVAPTNEEATVYVNGLDLIVTVLLPNDTPPVPSLGKLSEDHGESHELTGGDKPHPIQKGKKIPCKTENCVPIVVLGLSSGASSSSMAPALTTSSPQDLCKKTLREGQ